MNGLKLTQRVVAVSCVLGRLVWVVSIRRCDLCLLQQLAAALLLDTHIVLAPANVKVPFLCKYAYTCRSSDDELCTVSPVEV